jgi:hypothetical protein
MFNEINLKEKGKISFEEFKNILMDNKEMKNEIMMKIKD